MGVIREYLQAAKIATGGKKLCFAKNVFWFFAKEPGIMFRTLSQRFKQKNRGGYKSTPKCFTKEEPIQSAF